MEPVTHLLTGAVLARTGFNRRTAYAAAAMIVAAELPDIDVLWSLGGPVTGFMHHRGITHTFLGVPFEAALVTLCAWAIFRWRRKSATRLPFNWGWLFAGTLVALISHLLLDWTNNYGLRPFFPFDPHWYAGSFVFIFEPVMFAILVLALVGPWLFGLIDMEVGERKRPFRGRPSAILALIAILALYGLRLTERNRAIDLAAESASAGTMQVFASPYPGNPFEWHTVADAPSEYQLATVDTWRGIVLAPEPEDTLVKPAETLPLLVAKRTELGRVYLDWSMFPVLSAVPASSLPDADPTHPLTQVTFEDARFLYKTFLGDGRTHPPLSGSVVLDMEQPEGQRVIAMKLDGRPQD